MPPPKVSVVVLAETGSVLPDQLAALLQEPEVGTLVVPPGPIQVNVAAARGRAAPSASNTAPTSARRRRERCAGSVRSLAFSIAGRCCYTTADASPGCGKSGQKM